MGHDGLGIDTMRLCVVALLNEQGMRDGVVVQTGDVPQRERQVCRGLAVWRVKSAVLGGVLVGTHAYVESSLDGRNGALDLHVHAIARAANDREAVRLRETNHGVIVFLAGTKPFGELRHGEEMPVGGAGRIVEFLQKCYPVLPDRAAAEQCPGS